MASDITLTLGDIVFSYVEIPEKISFGGEQRLNVHELVGGARVIDVMGPTPMPIEWSGLFVGTTALDRALYVDGARKAGKALKLTWDKLAFNVVIRSFQCDYEAFKYPYRITCEVIEDLTSPVRSLPKPDIDQLVSLDMATANTLAVSVGDAKLSNMLGTLGSAISAVSTFARASQSTINTVLQPLADVRGYTKLLLTTTSNTIRNVSTLGGILPGNKVAGQATGLLNKMNALGMSGNLSNLDSVLGRMSVNFGMIGRGAKTIKVSNANLMSIAAKEYGDARGWTTIAQANNMTDPQVVGFAELTIPPAPSQMTGVPNA
jgi:hypothetical protein